jgi:peptidoglycan/xylan/chitin deacetylase (PgdA/CDA1 family)
MRVLPRSLLTRLPAAWRERLRLLAAVLLERRARWSRRRVGLVLVYHRIGDRPGDPRFELVPALGSDLFRAELVHLARRYRVVSAKDVPAAASARRRGGRFPVAITFDDDLVSHVEHAAPELVSAGLPGSFFLAGPSRVEPARMWWESLQIAIDSRLLRPEDLPPLTPSLVAASLDREPYAIRDLARAVESLPTEDIQTVEAELGRRTAQIPVEPALSADQIRSLSKGGLEIGFHTRDHRLLTTLDEQELRSALVDGKVELERVIGAPISMLAYPHGKADHRVAAAAREAGYALAFTGRSDPLRPDGDLLLIGRLEPRADTPGRFALEVSRALASA